MNAVDLGLSVLWADMNVDALSPAEAGGYFAWGETMAAKPKYDWTSYSLGSNDRMSRYNNSDRLTILQPQDDAAQVLCKGWRMPTREEFEELITKCNCTWENGNGAMGSLPGCRFTGPNGKSIFLPAADCIEDYFGRHLKNLRSVLHYWSANLATSRESKAALSLFFNIDGNELPEVVPHSRCAGFSIRPVCPRQ